MLPYLDYFKTFDFIDYNMLDAKMNYFEFSNNCNGWVGSYLKTGCRLPDWVVRHPDLL